MAQQNRDQRDAPREKPPHTAAVRMQGEPKSPRNQDQQQPPRKGETIESTVPEAEAPERERSGPLPEEETYERESGDRRSDGIH